MKISMKKNNISIFNYNSLYNSRIRSFKSFFNLLEISNKKRYLFFNIFFEFFQLLFKKSNFVLNKERLLQNVFKNYIKKRKKSKNNWVFFKFYV